MFKKDRRKFPRIDADVTVEVYTSSSHTAEPCIAEICTVINFSEVGMRFHASRRFDEKQLLRLTFLLPESIIIIRTNAQIIHTHQLKNKEVDVGVQFTNITMSERKLIRHFIGKKLNLFSMPAN